MSKNQKKGMKAYMVKGMVDSGANISIAKREVAERLGVDIKQYKDEKVNIQFGKEGATSRVIGYGNFGEILENITIVEDANDTLINMEVFTSKGMTVVFDRETVKVYDKGNVIIEGKCDEENLYYIYIVEAMKISLE